MRSGSRLRRLLTLSFLAAATCADAWAQGGVDSGLQSDPADAEGTSAAAGDARLKAREAYKAGAAAYAANDWAGAAKQFALAEQLYHAPTNLLGLGQAQERLGQWVEATLTFQAISGETLSSDAPAAFKAAQLEAQDAVQKLDQRIPRVVFAVLGGNPSRLTIDERDVPVDLDAELAVNPGPHTFKAYGSGTESVPVRARLSEGTTIRVTLKLTDLGSQGTRSPTGAGPAAEPLATGLGDGTRSSTHNPWLIPGIAAIGVGAVGLGLGASFFLARQNKKREFDRRFEACLAADCEDDELTAIEKLNDDTPRLGNLSLLSFGLGTAAAGAGVAMILLGGRSKKEHTTLGSVMPWVAPGRAGVGGTF